MAGVSLDEYLVLLVRTIGVEVPLVVSLTWVFWHDKHPARTMVVAAVANLISHMVGIGVLLPVAVDRWGAFGGLGSVESLIVVVEAGCYGWRFRERRDRWVGAVLLSGIANIASLGIAAL